MVTLSPLGNRFGQTARMRQANASQAPSVRFSGIFANFDDRTTDQYVKAFGEPQADEKYPLKAFKTELFRDFYTSNAVAQLLQKRTPTHVTVLGCSTGSTVHDLAILAKRWIASRKHIQDPKQIKLTGVDQESDLIAFANTGYDVLVDAEIASYKALIQRYNLPALLEPKSGPPENFDALVEKSLNRRLDHIKEDRVAGFSIGKEMGWYRIKHKLLPETTFEVDTIENRAAQKPTAHQRQIYVLANSWGYMLVQNASNTADMKAASDDYPKIARFLAVLTTLKKSNKDKDVIIVLGEMEKKLLRELPAIKMLLPGLGMTELSVDEMRQAGINERPEEVSGKIWRLAT
jgi:hypothetical protein